MKCPKDFQSWKIYSPFLTSQITLHLRYLFVCLLIVIPGDSVETLCRDFPSGIGGESFQDALNSPDQWLVLL